MRLQSRHIATTLARTLPGNVATLVCWLGVAVVLGCAGAAVAQQPQPAEGANETLPALETKGDANAQGDAEAGNKNEAKDERQAESDAEAEEDRALIDKLTRRVTEGSDGDLMDQILRLMQQSTRKLEIEFKPGAETQALQADILKKLDEAIQTAAQQRRKQRQQSSSSSDRRTMPKPKEQSKQEQQAGASEEKQSAQSSGDQAPTAGGEPSEAENQAEEWSGTRRTWGHLPQRDREEVIQGTGERFLERYRTWIERYYRALQEDDPQRQPD
jgi:hypothetical protein